MLIGCCHCEEESEPSVPSESVPSDSESYSVGSSGESLIELIGVPCNFCIALPAAWRVTVSGVTGQLPVDNTCCQTYNQSYILNWAPNQKQRVGSVEPANQCGFWRASENIKRFWSGFPTPAYCSEFTNGGRVLMCATADPNSIGFFVDIIYSQSGPASVEKRSYGLITTNCLYTGALDLLNPGTGQKCTAATVSISPA